MRFTDRGNVPHRHSLKNRFGERRVQTAFLIWPKTLLNSNGRRETRWLETASWLERVATGEGMHEGYRYFWYPIRWLDDEDG